MSRVGSGKHRQNISIIASTPMLGEKNHTSRMNMVRILEGPIQKKSPKGMLGTHMWQPRYFILYSDELQYFKKAGSAEPVGTLRLNDISQVEHFPNKKSGRRFDINLTGTKRLFALLAPDRQEALRWVNALNVAIQSQSVPQRSGRVGRRESLKTGNKKKYWKRRQSTGNVLTDARKRLSTPILNSMSNLLSTQNSKKKLQPIDKTSMHLRGTYFAGENERVLLAACNQSGSSINYLLHCIRIPHHTEAEYERVHGMAKSLTSIENKNKIAFLPRIADMGEVKSKLYGNVSFVLYDYPGHQTLLSTLRSTGRLKIKAVVAIGCELASMIYKFHKLENLAVHSLRPDLVHLTQNGHVVYIDPWMRLSREMSPMGVGPREYIPPELLEDAEDVSSDVDMDMAGDWWRLGILLYECAVGLPPFRAHSNAALIDEMNDDSKLVIPNFIPPQLQSVLKLLLDPNPQSRSKDDAMWSEFVKIANLEEENPQDFKLRQSLAWDILPHCRIDKSETDYNMTVRIIRGEGFGPLSRASQEGRMAIFDLFPETKRRRSSVTQGTSRDRKDTSPDDLMLICELSHAGQTAKAVSKDSVDSPQFDTECHFAKADVLAPFSIKVFVGRMTSRRVSVNWTCVGMINVPLDEIERMTSKSNGTVERWFEVVSPNLTPAGRLSLTFSLEDNSSRDEMLVQVSSDILDAAFSYKKGEQESLAILSIDDDEPNMDIKIMRGESKAADKIPDFEIHKIDPKIRLIFWANRSKPCHWAKLTRLAQNGQDSQSQVSNVVYSVRPHKTDPPAAINILNLSITLTDHGIPTFENLLAFGWRASKALKKNRSVNLICDTFKSWAAIFLASLLVISGKSQCSEHAIHTVEKRLDIDPLSSSQRRYIRYLEKFHGLKSGEKLRRFCWGGQRCILRFVRIKCPPKSLKSFSFRVYNFTELKYDHKASGQLSRLVQRTSERKKNGAISGRALETPCYVHMRGDIRMAFYDMGGSSHAGTKSLSKKASVHLEDEPLFSFCFHTSCIRAGSEDKISQTKILSVDSLSPDFVWTLHKSFQVDLFFSN
mmetsp:Transcript_15940/g.24032  ORF Transcript_15940/g.24032 Transcript_15940/m.24032 type:complete len:1056 (+) Transcript_15940:106-3273(+)